MATNVVREASELLSSWQVWRAADTCYTTPRITKVTIVVREQSREGSYFEAPPEPRGVERTFN